MDLLDQLLNTLNFLDGCYARDIEKIEKVQLSAARIVTGLLFFFYI